MKFSALTLAAVSVMALGVSARPQDKPADKFVRLIYYAMDGSFTDITAQQTPLLAVTAPTPPHPVATAPLETLPATPPAAPPSLQVRARLSPSPQDRKELLLLAYLQVFWRL
jgi:hypothetical protein